MTITDLVIAALLAWAVLSYVVVGVNWVLADYWPSPRSIILAFLIWPGWVLSRWRAQRSPSAVSEGVNSNS